MKFQCDRCKTRYSIADERVRGKILKIRCKNCEAVISVREGMDAPSGRASAAPASKAVARKASAPAGKSPTIDSKPVLRGAFAKAMDSSSRAPAAPLDDDGENTVISDPPSQLEEEWYVSLEGEQFGPFNLLQARDWVTARRTGEEIFCWSEGFDDWLPVEKVSQLRRARPESAPPPRASSAAPPIPAAAAARRPSAPSAIAAAPPAITPTSEETPKPLFAATMAAIERAENPSVEKLAREATAGANGRSKGKIDDGTEEGFEFDIGEASQVVQLPHLVAAALQGGGAEGPASSGLPGMQETPGGGSRVGSGTGGFATVGKLSGGAPIVVPLSEEAMAAAAPDVLKPTSRRHGLSWYLVVGGCVVAAVAVVVIMLMVGSGEDAGSGRMVRSRASAEGLGHSLDPRTIKIIETREVPVESRSGASRRRTGTTSSGTDSGETSSTSAKTSIFGKTDDFDLTTANNDEDRPLNGDDLLKVYQDNRLAVKLCYERALKKDPLLDVRKIYVAMTVSTAGVVTKVMLSSHQESELGQCLVQRMRKWRFRRSPEEFSGRFPLVFRN